MRQAPEPLAARGSDVHRHGHRPVLPTSRQGRIPRFPQGRSPAPIAPPAPRRMRQIPDPQDADVTGWLAKNPRIALHFTPTSGDPGSTWLKCSSASSPGRPSAAAPSTAQGTHHRHPDLHHRLERPLPPLRLDQNRRRNPQLVTGVFFADLRCRTQVGARRTERSEGPAIRSHVTCDRMKSTGEAIVRGDSQRLAYLRHDREEQSGRTISALGFVLRGPRVDRGVTVITSENGAP
jgi:hypothetical protein